ncbi:MAG: hypothetical protein HY040_06255 [Planctomycetes bacterium]|nr:hypothetical protein [Planctomycetota bacterium]
MAKRILILALICAITLLSPASARAFGGRWWSSARGTTTVVYCPVVIQPVPVVWICAPTSPRVIPLMPQAQPYAAPSAAPPSGVPSAQTKEPPLGSAPGKGPTIIESRSSVAAGPATPAGAKCKVGFWNLTGRDVTLKIDGQPRTLPRDRAVTLELARAFVWQVDQSEASSEQVPMDEAFHEVIIRK